jgi:C-terminal processing protease CtpA/Prc
VVFTLGQALVEEAVPFVVFTTPSLDNPGLFSFGQPLRMQPAQPHFGGRVAVLVDESSISKAEYTAMALRASPRARIYGRQTAGADGNVSNVGLPGDLAASMTGIGVFNPDRSPTQRLGVRLDVECPVTVAGLREGRDEILDCALKDLAAAP